MKVNFKIYIVHYKKLVERKKIMENSLRSHGMSYYFESDYDRTCLKPTDKNKFSNKLEDAYKANFLLNEPKIVEPSSKSNTEVKIFVAAKEVQTIDAYAEKEKINKLI